MTDEVIDDVENVEQEQSYEDAFSEFAEGKTDKPEFDPEPEANVEEVEEPKSNEIDEGLDESAGEEPTDEISELERLRAENEEWKHKFYSDAGRVAALQKKINELENSSRTQEPSEQTAPEESPPELAEFKNDYPDIYQGVEKYIQTELARREEALRAEMQQQIAPVNQVFAAQQEAAEMAALEVAHPDWQQVATDTAFQEWLAAQPLPVQQMANSDYASEVSYVLNSFKTQARPQQPQQQPAAQGIAKKRAKQLEQSTGVSSRASASVSPLAEDDYSSAFKYYAAR